MTYTTITYSYSVCIVLRPLSYITLLSDKICPRFKEIRMHLCMEWLMQAQVTHSVSWRFSHFRLVSASSLLNASCYFLSAWSFLEGFSDRYLRIFSNSAQRLMVCLPLVIDIELGTVSSYSPARTSPTDP